MTIAKAKKAINLEKFSMKHDAEWMLVAPSRYDDYATITEDYKDLSVGNVVVIEGTISSKRLLTDQNHPCDFKIASRLFVEIRNDRGQLVSASAFGRPGFAWQTYHVGTSVTLRGKVKQGFNGLMEISMVEIVPPQLKGKIVPIYPNIKVTPGERFREKISEHYHYSNITAAVVAENTGWNDPKSVISIPDVSGFSTASELIKSLHRPSSVEEGERAKRAARLISGLALIRNTLLRAESLEEDLESAIPISSETVEDLQKRLPFSMTTDQLGAVAGIIKSLQAPIPMSGLISGDVGSGKTATFTIPMIAAFLAGAKVTLLTPNLLLIDQVASEIRSTYPEIPVCTINGKQGALGDPENSIIIGNTALIGAYKKGKIKTRPHFLVIDEQHKFSVEQRQSIATDYTNVIEATATPIPRTAALVTHGTADVYLLKQIPVEKVITTKVMMRHQAREARDEIISAIYERKEQAAVVYPLVATDNPEKSRSAVTDALASWSNHVSPDLIAVLHGKMTDEEKHAVLQSFKSGEKRLLLASTVIEVGLTLPELKTMMVIDADRFGVVTLHQLRGRLARHGGKGLMMLFANDPSESALDRLSLLVQHSDGFVLAEKDAEQRGYGDILGNDGDTQSGKTKTLFLGVNVGPGEISFAANLYAKAGETHGIKLPTDPIATAKKKKATELRQNAENKPQEKSQPINRTYTNDNRAIGFRTISKG